MLKKDRNSTIIFDRVVEFEEGVTLRFLVDASRFNILADQYKTALLMSRGIPSQVRGQLDPTSNLAQEIITKMPYLRGQVTEINKIAEAFYDQERQTAQYEGSLLAMIASSENKFPDDPTEYTPEEILDSEIPGLITLTPPTRNLNNPTERRLKQMFDFYLKAPARVDKFLETVDDCWTAIAELMEKVNAANGNFRINRSD